MKTEITEVKDGKKVLITEVEPKTAIWNPNGMTVDVLEIRQVEGAPRFLRVRGFLSTIKESDLVNADNFQIR